MTHSKTSADQERSRWLPQRIWRSVVRGPLFPQERRGRLRLVMDNLILHIHPSQVSARSLKFTYTWGLGGLSALLMMILGVTGVMLMFVYTPTPETAYNDVVAIGADVWFGALVRSLHHWTGNAMVLVVFMHMLRVFFTGAFRPPREFNWLLGMALLLLTVAANFTGYLLPWDQLAYWAVTVATSLMSYVPLVGDWLGNLLLGGPEVGAATLRNFYGLHIAVIPGAMMGIMAYHFWRVRKDGGLTVPRGVDEPPIKKAERVTTVPHLVQPELVFALVAIAGLLLWAMWVPAPLEELADPDHAPNPAKAAWYLLGLQELLLHFHPLIAAVVIPALALGTLALLPYLDADMDSVGIWFRSRRGRHLALVSVIVGVILTPALVLLDEYVLNLPALLPSLPTLLSNGVVPLAASLLGLIAYYELLRRMSGATDCETKQALFSLMLTGFIMLTIVGIFFRGKGMALVWPWGGGS